MKSEVEAHSDFQLIRYAQAWEDPRCDLEGWQVQPEDDVLDKLGFWDKPIDPQSGWVSPWPMPRVWGRIPYPDRACGTRCVPSAARHDGLGGAVSSRNSGAGTARS